MKSHLILLSVEEALMNKLIISCGQSPEHYFILEPGQKKHFEILVNSILEKNGFQIVLIKQVEFESNFKMKKKKKKKKHNSIIEHRKGKKRFFDSDPNYSKLEAVIKDACSGRLQMPTLKNKKIVKEHKMISKSQLYRIIGSRTKLIRSLSPDGHVGNAKEKVKQLIPVMIENKVLISKNIMGIECIGLPDIKRSLK